MVPSMTPTGVEHAMFHRYGPVCLPVVPSMTPTGVEHRTLDLIESTQEMVVPSMTPTGVEHRSIGNGIVLSLGGSFNDADRR